MAAIDKELDELLALIEKKNKTPADEHVLFGIYHHWAEIAAIKNLLVKKNIISKKEIYGEMVPILKRMKRDFK